ncbi:hypothetical protein ACPPVT_06615 [Angustibacter sp. McL0619]|uniref:hypothetical protein n=1 Tax=Angustibacter sp. McL0619 TaxID=3415676 RepID=UPI003CEEA471
MSRWRMVLGALGIGAMGWAAWLVLSGGVVTPPVPMATWLAAVLIAHDLVLAPIVVALGWLVARIVPAKARSSVAVAFLVCGSVVLMSAPLWLGQLLGQLPTGNPSVDPLDYRRNVLLVTAVLCLVVVLGAFVRSRTARDQPPAEGPGTSDPRLPNAPRD